MLKKATNRFGYKRLSFKQKITLCFLIVSIVPIMILGTISYNISKNVVIDLETQRTYDSMNSEVDKIYSILKDIDGVSISLFSNSYIQSVLADNISRKTEITPDIYNKLADITSDIHSTRDFLSAISIYGKNGIVYKSKGYYSTIYTDYDSCRAYMVANKMYGLNALYGTELLYFTDSFNFNILHFQIVRDITSLDELGVIVLSIKEEYLGNMYQGADANSFIVDRNGKIISSNHKDDIGKSIVMEDYFQEIMESTQTPGSLISKVNNVTSLVFYSKVKGFDLYLVNLVPYESLIQGSYAIRDLSLFTMLIFIIVSFILTFYIIKGLTSPLLKLKALMEKVEEGNMDVQFITKGHDEISFLGDSFNHMIVNIKESIIEIEKQQKLKKKSEMNLLQAQINPHYLYNTLDSLQNVIKEGDILKSEEIIKAFIKFFKISLSKGEMMIPISQEVEHILSYVAIQNYCYRKNIHCMIDIAPHIMDLMIVKLTFQPIVENAILHGFKNYQDNGEIHICAQENTQDGTIVISLSPP